MRSLMLIAIICIVLSIMMHQYNAETPVTTERPTILLKRYMIRRAAYGFGDGANGGMGFGFGANTGSQAGGEAGQGGH